MKYSNSNPMAAPTRATAPQKMKIGMGEVTNAMGMRAKMALTLVRTLLCRNQRRAM